MIRLPLSRSRPISRDTKLIAFFSLAALMCVSALAVHFAVADGPPIRTVDARVDVGSDDRLSIQFLGDTMLGDAAQPKLNRNGYDWPFRPTIRATLDGDFTIANSETPFTYRTKPYDPGKEYSYTSEPTAIGALQRAGIDAVSLANNHAMDAGPIGLTETLTYLADNKMPSFGAGPSINRAEEPLILRSSEGTVGIVGLGENFGSSIRAEDSQAGTVVLSSGSVQRGVDLARAAGADWVIAFVHWGDNYMPVNDEQRYWARQFVEAGYDMVVGAGPHITQPIRFIQGIPIVYSLGNFVFGAPGRFQEYDHTLGHGLMLTATLSKTNGIRLKLRCLITDNEVVRYRPKMCSNTQAAHLMSVLTPRAVTKGAGALVDLPAAMVSNGD